MRVCLFSIVLPFYMTKFGSIILFEVCSEDLLVPLLMFVNRVILGNC